MSRSFATVRQLLYWEYSKLVAGSAIGNRRAFAFVNTTYSKLLASNSALPDILRENIQKCKQATDKPFGVNVPMLYPNLEEIIQTQSARNQSERAVFISHATGDAFIGIKDILFAEVQNKTTSLFTTEGIFRINRKSLLDIISIVDDDFFLRCHRSFALNVKQIKGIETVDRRIWRAVFEKQKETCLISQTYLDAILEKYKAFHDR